MTGNRLMFLVMCAIWGATLIAIKIGVEAVPPLMFAASRFLAAGILILGWLYCRSRSLCIGRRDWPRLLVTASLIVAATYGFLFWSLQHVPTGLAAVINLSLIPIGLYTIGLAHREESFSLRQSISLVIGVLGLVVLFWPKLSKDGVTVELLGLSAIVVATLAYCWGSILNRPLLRRHSPVLISGLTTLIGGVYLAVLALAFEPAGEVRLAALFGPEIVASWLFLVLFGSVAAFTIYLRLIRDWGPARAGLYGFVSPVIALAIGILAYQERFGPPEALGSTLLLLAAWLALRGPAGQARSSASSSSPCRPAPSP